MSGNSVTSSIVHPPMSPSSRIAQLQSTFKVVFLGISSFPREKGEYVDSGVVTIQRSSWLVRMYLGGYDTERSFCMCLYSASDVRAICQLTLYNHLDSYRSISKRSASFRGTDVETYLKSDDLLDQRKGFVLNDSITVLVNISMLDDVIITLADKCDNARHSVLNDLHPLLFDELSCDFCIIIITLPQICALTVTTVGESNECEHKELPRTGCEGNDLMHIGRIPVHRFILQARSPVFRAMLSSGMVECTSNQIVMSDFRCKVVREFVRFLYTDTCCDTSVLMQHGRSLLALAHKYEVKGLVHECERYLVGTLSADNAVELLQLADVFGCKELKKHATVLIKINCMHLIKQSQFYYCFAVTHLPLTSIPLLRHSREDSR